MTTSILTPNPGQLNDYDIQVLKDFALDAPWEWRKALESLIEYTEEADGREQELEKDVAQLEALSEAVGDLLEEFRSELEANAGKLPGDLEKSFHESLDALEKVLKKEAGEVPLPALPPPPAPPAKIELITVKGALP